MTRGASCLLALALLSCGDDTLPGRLEKMEANCVVIVIDAAAAGHFQTWGYERETAPRIARLGEEGVIFDRAYSQAPSTVTSVASYFTGAYPHSIARKRADGTESELAYVSQAFAAAGFRTAGFAANMVVGIAIRGREAFEHWVGFVIGERKPGRLRSDILVERALRWVDSLEDERFFLYVHLMPPHGPYLPPDEHVLFRPEGYAGDVRPESHVLEAIDRGRREITTEDADFIVSQYDANLHYADHLVGTLLDGLRERGELGRSVVVLLSDHGEAFGQHGRWVHNTTLYDEMIHVPLIIRLPSEVAPEPRRIDETVALVDLAPTLEDLFGLGRGLAQQGQGRSLRPALESEPREPDARRYFSQTREQVAVIEGGYKLIVRAAGETATQELYSLRQDPDERTNLAAEQAGRTREMRSALSVLLETGIEEITLEAASSALSEEAERQLNALGYLLPPDEPPALEDPEG